MTFTQMRMEGEARELVPVLRGATPAGGRAACHGPTTPSNLPDPRSQHIPSITQDRPFAQPIRTMLASMSDSPGAIPLRTSHLDAPPDMALLPRGPSRPCWATGRLG